MAEGLDHLFIAHGFVDESGLFPPDGGLFLEQPVGPVGDEPGHQKADRGQHHHHQGNLPVGGKHEVQGQYNGHQTGEQLGKAQEQPVRDLVHIGDHPLDQVPGAVAVQEGKGQLLDLPDGPAPDIPDGVEGQFVVDQVHGPGGQTGQDHQHQDLEGVPFHQSEIHLARPCNAVDGPAEQDGHIQLQGHGSPGQDQAPHEEQPVGVDDLPDFFQSFPTGIVLFLAHQASSFPCASS